MTGDDTIRPSLRGRLVGSARTVWAKHDRDTEGWLPLWCHMEDSAAVAGLLYDTWLPENVKALLADSLPGQEQDARLLLVWLAAIHDIGKATPAFASQVDSLADTMRRSGLDMPTARQFGPDRKMAPHSLAGQLLLSDWLEACHGWTSQQAAQFAVVVGGHHGLLPEAIQLTDLDDRPRLLRMSGPSRAVWTRVQTELLDACAAEFGVKDRLRAWSKVKLPQTVQVLLSGIVIVSDWIASNPDLFPYFPQERRQTSGERAAAAWRGLGLPGPWKSPQPVTDLQELFASRFSFPPGAKVRPVQEAAVRLARTMPAPGLVIIEAPMGEGKTEAALAVAEVFAQRAGAGGVFFALPTMATSNALFPRLLDWLRALPSESGEQLSVLLAHSKAALNEDYVELRRAGRRDIAAVDLDGGEDAGAWWQRPDAKRFAPAELVAHTWLSGRKKAMLSSFVAGTVDQLLFAGLKSRHLVLRHLAVAGKVVVIDEAHAYDTYMSEYLDRVLSWLGAYQVPVVVLSATLPAGRRHELAQAYAGSGGRLGSARIEAASETAWRAVLETADYPLLTAVSAGGAPPSLEAPKAAARGAAVRLEPFSDDLADLAGRLAELEAGGGCVLVVRNTVRRVLDTARVLRERFSHDAVTVAHSSFVDVDRAAKDADLLRRFGPSEKAEGRPEGLHIVVASQVAEQSLDVDFDLLVTDLCPVDLLLQRMGRLHRHARGVDQSERPEKVREARCLVTGVDWHADVPTPVRGSVAVYGAYTLLRAAAVLRRHLEEGLPVRLPEDISPVVQAAYGPEPIEPPGWSDTVDEARQRYEDHHRDQEQRANTFRIGEVQTPGRSLVGWVAAGVGDADDSRAGRAQVRDSRESLEVVVVQRQDDGTLTTLPWLGKGLGGLELPTDRAPSSKAARAAASCGLRLPIQFSASEVMDRAIAELEELFVPAWQQKDCHWLAGQLILALDADCQTHLAGFVLHYSESDGLEVTHA